MPGAKMAVCVGEARSYWSSNWFIKQNQCGRTCLDWTVHLNPLEFHSGLLEDESWTVPCTNISSVSGWWIRASLAASLWTEPFPLYFIQRWVMNIHLPALSCLKRYKLTTAKWIADQSEPIWQKPVYIGRLDWSVRLCCIKDFFGAWDYVGLLSHEQLSVKCFFCCF